MKLGIQYPPQDPGHMRFEQFSVEFIEWCIKDELNRDKRTKIFKEIVLRESGDRRKKISGGIHFFYKENT